MKSEKKYNTLKGYVTTYRILKEIAPKLSFADVDIKLIKKLDYHLTVVRKNRINSKFGKHKNLRFIIGRAVAEGFMKQNPYDAYPIKQEASDRAFLTLEELEKVRNCDVSNEKMSIQIAKDYFIFGTCTGLRFSDIAALKYKSIKNDHLELNMQKTGNFIVIPLMPQARQIVDKYCSNTIVFDEKLVFPKSANATINRGLKDLMKLAGVDKKVSMHVSRHTFATIHLHTNKNIAGLKTLMGHSDIKTTLIYAKTMNEDLFTSINNLSAIYGHMDAI